MEAKGEGGVRHQRKALPPPPRMGCAGKRSAKKFPPLWVTLEPQCACAYDA